MSSIEPVSHTENGGSVSVRSPYVWLCFPRSDAPSVLLVPLLTIPPQRMMFATKVALAVAASAAGRGSA